MARVLVDVDPLTGTSHYASWDNDDTFRFQQEVDHQPLADINAERRAAAHPRWGDGKPVASIPMPLWWLLKTTGVLDDPKALARWLNDPAHRHFRTREGRV